MGQPTRESKQAWLERNLHKRPTINRNSRLRRSYGIHPEEFYHMLVAQQGKCAICKQLFGDEKQNSPHIDHDHTTQWVRGILCQTCNTSLGGFKDSIENLESAIDYLISTATPTEFVFTPIDKPRKYTDQWKEAARKRYTGNRYREGKSPWNKGKFWSEETKQKMSESAKRRKHSQEIAL